MKSITRNRLYNSVLASFIEIDFNNIDNTNIKIKKQLSFEKKDIKIFFSSYCVNYINNVIEYHKNKLKANKSIENP